MPLSAPGELSRCSSSRIFCARFSTVEDGRVVTRVSHRLSGSSAPPSYVHRAWPSARVWHVRMLYMKKLGRNESRCSTYRATRHTDFLCFGRLQAVLVFCVLETWISSKINLLWRRTDAITARPENWAVLKSWNVNGADGGSST